MQVVRHSTVAVCLIMAWSVGVGARQPAAPGATLPGEWMVAQPSVDVLRAARETLRDQGFDLERDDAGRGILISKRRTLDASWPSGEALGLPVTQTPVAVAYHVYVAPGFVPARLVIGAILDTRTVFVPLRLPRARGASTAYSQVPMAELLARQIASRLGVPLVPMPAPAEARAMQAAALAGPAAGTCGPSALVTDLTSRPTPVSDVKPEYPALQLSARRGGVVTLRGELTEHGTLTGLDWVDGVEDRNLVAAATGAAGLWRFVAPAVDGCPGRRTIFIQMAFGIR